MSVQTHYDTVTDAWALILGDNLHYGYFARGGETLSEATEALIDAMAGLAPLGRETEVLDVGCGTGHPAFRLAERAGCRITGISISGRGIQIAEEASRRKGLADRVAFHRRDALDNGFPDASFDVAWVMESSHLMPDKERLCAECHRVLRPGGTMVLCDQILKRPLSIAELYRLRRELIGVERAFGPAKMETLDFYESTMRAHRFGRIERRDVSRETLPTLGKWRENLERNRAALTAQVGAEYVDNFARSCDVLAGLFASEMFGYGIVKGVKDGR
jgi:27-O-demethylrifamycin SV methyltransferase